MEPEYRLKEDVVSTELDDSEAVILNLKSRHYYTLNETGSVIWAAMKDSKSVEQIADDLVASFEIDHAGAVTHVRAFLEDLARDGLVDLDPSSD
jgi:hypothetical protein